MLEKKGMLTGGVVPDFGAINKELLLGGKPGSIA
jgi:hypothetical protein